jgi:hypothetical protein
MCHEPAFPLRALVFSFAALGRNSFFSFGLYRVATRCSVG